jgi:hypothetical protein
VPAESGADSAAPGGSGIVVSGLLVVFAILFYVTALRMALAHEDGDAPPPKWMNKAESMSSMAAFGAGAGYVAISAKLWVFTLGAIGAIGEAGIGRVPSVVTFVAFVVLTLSGNLAVLGFAAASPDRSATALARFADRLQRNNRIIVIALGLVFGTPVLTVALMRDCLGSPATDPGIWFEQHHHYGRPRERR